MGSNMGTASCASWYSILLLAQCFLWGKMQILRFSKEICELCTKLDTMSKKITVLTAVVSPEHTQCVLKNSTAVMEAP